MGLEGQRVMKTRREGPGFEEKGARQASGQFGTVSGHSVFIPRGLLITFVRATIPRTLHAAILFSCLCFYDFLKRTAPKIHKNWHLVNLINVR